MIAAVTSDFNERRGYIDGCALSVPGYWNPTTWWPKG